MPKHFVLDASGNVVDWSDDPVIALSLAAGRSKQTKQLHTVLHLADLAAEVRGTVMALRAS